MYNNYNGRFPNRSLAGAGLTSKGWLEVGNRISIRLLPSLFKVLLQQVFVAKKRNALQQPA